MKGISTRDRSLLERIVANCQSISDRLNRYDIDRGVFVENADLREMVLFPLVQIGELANHFSMEFLSDHEEVPWSDIVGMRHIIVHGYDAFDASWAWSTIENDVPELIKACSDILRSVSKDAR